eukprot:SAG31_NODE_9226_length_1313_cov_1.296540_1_plen_153_part_00
MPNSWGKECPASQKFPLTKKKGMWFALLTDLKLAIIRVLKGLYGEVVTVTIEMRTCDFFLFSPITRQQRARSKLQLHSVVRHMPLACVARRTVGDVCVAMRCGHVPISCVVLRVLEERQIGRQVHAVRCRIVRRTCVDAEDCADARDAHIPL